MMKVNNFGNSSICIPFNSTKSRNKDVVNLLYGYTEASVTKKSFDSTFPKMIEVKTKKQQVLPGWLNKLTKMYQSINEEKAMEMHGYYTDSEFRYSIMETLQKLKESNKFSSIIRKDYSKFL